MILTPFLFTKSNTVQNCISCTILKSHLLNIFGIFHVFKSWVQNLEGKSVFDTFLKVILLTCHAPCMTHNFIVGHARLSRFAVEPSKLLLVWPI